MADTSAGSRRGGGRAALGLLCCVWLLSGCGTASPARPVPWSPRPFVVTFWCAPPLAELDDARLAEIAAAGFTTVGAPCGDELAHDANHRLLAGAARHGLRVWLADHRLYEAARGFADPSVAAAVAADFRDAPALDGYMVADEPTAERFAAVAATVRALHAADPGRLAYVNLLPDYVPAPLLGTASYTDYLERFVAEVRPQALSVDYYPFGEHKDRSTFFTNLAALRETAQRHDLPFVWIVLAMPHGPYRDPSEGELAWQVFHALAYGARGISYFTYWTPPPGDWNNRNGLIEHGRPTLRYFQVQRLNRTLRALGAALDGWRSIAVADAHGAIGLPLPLGPLAAVEGGQISIGLFGDGRGSIAALLVNRDYRYATTATVRLRPGVGAPETLDPDTDRWHATPRLQWVLEPGGARLLRWPAT